MEERYTVEETSRGYAIYFVNRYGRIENISDNLSSKQANKWCDRLNSAYYRGAGSQW